MVADRQTSVTAFAGQFHSAAGSFNDRNAVALHQTDAARIVEMVQHHGIGGFFDVLSYNGEILSAFGSARGPTRAWQPVHVVLFRSPRGWQPCSCKPITSRCSVRSGRFSPGLCISSS